MGLQMATFKAIQKEPLILIHTMLESLHYMLQLILEFLAGSLYIQIEKLLIASLLLC